MTDSLEGLSAELRKAAIILVERESGEYGIVYRRLFLDSFTEEDLVRYDAKLWLLAALAAKEMRKLKEKLKYFARWICFGCNSSWENHGDDAKCGNCGKERELWVRLDKVEDAFK